MLSSFRQIGLAAWLIIGVAQTAHAGTLDNVKQGATLRCGVNGTIPGLSLQDKDGRWSGFDVDFCRAVAIAVLGDPNKVEFVRLTNQDRLEALRENRVDLLSRNTTWTMERDLAHAMDFVGVLYYDGQGFLVPRAGGKMSVLELSGAAICVQAGSTSERHLERFFARHRMTYRTVAADSFDTARDAYLGGRCDALTSDQSQLYALRSTLADPAAQKILPETISKEPLSPAVRTGDDQWRNIVEWTLYALINAEELDINSTNIDRVREQATTPDVRYFLDLDGASSKALGLAPQWTVDLVRKIGNYGEMFERNLGKQSALGIKRGMNALWRDGGLLYAPPLL